MKKLLFFLCPFLSFQNINAQSVGIGTSDPNASAQLEIAGTIKELPSIVLRTTLPIKTRLKPKQTKFFEQIIQSALLSNLIREEQECTGQEQRLFYHPAF